MSALCVSRLSLSLAAEPLIETDRTGGVALPSTAPLGRSGPLRCCCCCDRLASVATGETGALLRSLPAAPVAPASPNRLRVTRARF